MLASDDRGGYRALFERAGGVEDPHERYRCLRGLLEQGLAAAARASAATVPQLYAAVAEAGLDVLEAEPREPVLAQLRRRRAATSSAPGAPPSRCSRPRAAWTPRLPHVDANMEQIAPPPQGRPTPPPRVPAHGRGRRCKALDARGERAAARAVPATGLTLSLCMIVKDEEEMLPRCLAAAAPAVDEIVVVDTGSSDRTVEIASPTARTVLEFAWNGSFADARNVSLERRHRRLAHLPRRRRGAGRGRSPSACARCAATPGARPSTSSRPTTPATSRTAPPSPTTPCAMFRNRPEYRFEGRLHEQIAHAHAGRPGRALRAHRRARRALRLPRRRARRQGEVAPQHRAARAPGGRGRRHPVPRLQPRLRVRRRRRRRPPRWRSSSAPGTGCAARTTSTSAATSPRCCPA